MRKGFATLFIVIISSFNSFANENNYQEQPWGLGIVARGVNTSFDTKTEPDSSFVPLMFYQGDSFFMRGLEIGAHLYKEDKNQVNVIGRMTFFDAPEEYQDEIKGYHIDLGLQWRTSFNQSTELDFEILSDLDKRFYGNITSHWYYDSGDWELMPSLTARYKSADFNSQYFSLEESTNERIGAGIEINANVETRYHVNSNFYLIGSMSITALDKNSYESSAINQRWNSELYLGFAFFNDKSKPKKDKLTSTSYLRVSHGWATPSDIGDIIVGNIDSDGHGVKDEYNNQFSSIFYGMPIADEFFGFPVDIYVTPGFVWHWDSEIQSTEQEYVLALKAYTTFSWPVKWRIGLAEGLSYITNITYIEAKEMAWKGYEGNNLLNYIDVSIDVNVGDLFNSRSLEDVWFGYGLHHRSAVFGSASQFGRIEGGSNYNTLYFQFGF